MGFEFSRRNENLLSYAFGIQCRPATELDLENTVHFLGFNDDPAEFLANLDMFLMSSISEGFSIATIQAMAAGLPVIVTRSGGPEEIVSHQHTGLMIEPGDPRAIAEAIETFGTDLPLKEKLAENGRDHASMTFGIDTMLRSYEAIYADLL